MKDGARERGRKLWRNKKKTFTHHQVVQVLCIDSKLWYPEMGELDKNLISNFIKIEILNHSFNSSMK